MSKERILVNLKKNTVRVSGSSDIAHLIGDCSIEAGCPGQDKGTGVIRINTNYRANQADAAKVKEDYIAARGRYGGLKNQDVVFDVWFSLMTVVQDKRRGIVVSLRGNREGWAIEYDTKRYGRVVVS
jgi:hypothetical protein